MPGARAIVPGKRSLSMVYLRMARRQDVYNMHPLALSEVDEKALAGVCEWIEGLGQP